MAYSMSCKNGHFEKSLVSPQETLLALPASLPCWHGKVQDRDNCKNCILMGIALSNSFSTAFDSELQIVKKQIFSNSTIPLCMGAHLSEGSEKRRQHRLLCKKLSYLLLR